MRKRCKGHASSRVLNELRQTSDCEYSRARRLGRLKEVLWLDNRYHETNSWKDSRKTQHREESRGERHERYLDEKSATRHDEWHLSKYLRDNNIPFRLVPKYKTVVLKSIIRTKRVKDRQVPVYTWHFSNEHKFEISHQIGFKWEYIDVPLDKPYVKRYKQTTLIGHTLIWWSDKDIGIDYILRRLLGRV